MSNLDGIQDYVEDHFPLNQYEDTADAYKDISAQFERNGRIPLDKILKDEKSLFLDWLGDRVSQPSEIEPDIEPIGDSPLFVPTGETTTIDFTESNEDYITRRRNEGGKLRQIAEELNINYNTLRGNLSKLSRRKSNE